MTTAVRTSITIPAKPLRQAINKLFRKSSAESQACLRVSDGKLYLERHEDSGHLSYFICTADSDTEVAAFNTAISLRNFIAAVTPKLSDPACETTFVSLDIAADEVTVRSGNDAFSLSVKQPPSVPETETYFHIPTATFKEAIMAIERARGEDIKVINSITFSCEPDKVRLLASDRFRIAHRYIEISPLIQVEADKAYFIVNGALLENLVRCADSTGDLVCKMTRGDGPLTLIFHAGNARAVLEAGTEPVPFGCFFKGDTASVVQVDVAAFRAAMKTVVPRMAQLRWVQINMQDGYIECTVSTRDGQETVVNHGFSGSGTAVFRVDAQYFCDGLHCLDCDDVALFLQKDSGRRPIRMNPAVAHEVEAFAAGDSSASYVLMPMRIL